MTDHTYNQLRSQLQKHKENERIYRDKLKEVNSTRSKINDQLDMLHQTYDKKIKHLQQKLEQLKLHNQTLTKQNILFRTEIDTYHNRLLDKEKIIALLLQQKKELIHLNSSDRSKSEKTDSLQANEDEKIFKKQVPLKEEIQTNSIKNNLKPNSQSQVYKEEAEKEVLSQQVENNIEEVRKVVPPPPPKKKKEPLQQVHQLQEQVLHEQPTREVQAEHHEPVAKRAPPPPPGNKKAAQRKVPSHPKRQVHRVQEAQENENDSQLLMSYFSVNSHQNLQDSREHKELKHAHEPFGPVSDHQYRQEYNHQAEDAVVQQEVSPASDALQGQYREQFEGRQHENQAYRQQLPLEQNLEQVEASNPVEYLQQQYNRQQQQQEVQVQEIQNGFLSHFTNNRNESMEELTRPKAIQKKTKKQHKKYHQTSFEPQNTEQTSNNSDFFNQLSKQEGEVPHHALDIEESSIDHADRDSSLISNEQPYFAEDGAFRQEQQRPKPKNVKMTKKKGKRDQIKVADPSLFE